MLTLRPTTPADLPAVVAWEADENTVCWLGDTARGWHERALVDPGQDHLVAEAAGTPVGFAVLAGLGASDGTAELRRIVVDPARRGAGRGRALLRAVLDRAAGFGARDVWLDVKPGNDRARSLYVSEGFVETAAIGPLVIMRRR